MLQIIRITGLCFVIAGLFTVAFTAYEIMEPPREMLHASVPAVLPKEKSEAPIASGEVPIPEKEPRQARSVPSEKPASPPETFAKNAAPKVRVAKRAESRTQEPPKALPHQASAAAHSSARRGGSKIASCDVLVPEGTSGYARRVRKVITLIKPEIEFAASQTGIDCKVLISKIAQECGDAETREGLRLCRGSKGERGPAQMMPQTARGEFGVEVSDLDNLQTNVLLGAKYLKRLFDRSRSMEQALMAYNAGYTAAEHFVNAGYHPRQNRYVQSVLSHARHLGVDYLD